MNSNLQVVAAYCGIAFVAFLTLGLWTVAGMFPPTAPALGPEEVAAIYQAGAGQLRLGLLIGMISAAFTIPWIALIAIYMARAEGGRFPILSITQCVAGAVTVVILLFPFVFWTVAAYRPERSPELIQLFSDLGWMLIVMTFGPFFVQLVSIGLAILLDRNAQPIFPRWTAYFNIWVAVLFIPGALITFFESGPFAWNGILAFWLPLAVFFGWYFVMFAVLLKVIKEQEAVA
ncbi:MAG: hypothetical protein ACU84Q_08525 [Gammaproteobacteria bacterium]